MRPERIILSVLFAIVVARAAWVGDDALVTMRTLDQFVHGHGLVYNQGERVQVYTHPLWMLTLLPVYAVWRYAYWVLLTVGFGLSLATFALIARRLVPPAATVLLITPSLSRAFVDYSTSGLENPLSHLLYAGLLAAWFAPGTADRRLAWTALCAGLLAVNRLDLALVGAPVVAAAAWGAWAAGVPLGRVVTRLAAGAAPLLAWEAFSLVYYGQLVPNTALAKLGHGHARGEVLTQGGIYLLYQLEWDAITLLVIVAGALAPWAVRDPAGRAVSAGIAAYVGYVVWIGGDFMAGRFLTTVFVGGLVLLARLPLPTLEARAAMAAVVVLAGLTGSAPPVFFDEDREHRPIDPRGIADERAYYVGKGAGIGRVRNDSRDPEVGWRHHAVALGRRGVHEGTAIGFPGIDARRDAYLFTRYALTDPLLPRLPPRYFPGWRPGHYDRAVPRGYEASLRENKNLLQDPDLAALWDALRVVHRGPIFAPARWREIWRLHTGYYRISRPNDHRYPDAAELDPPGTTAARGTKFTTPGAKEVGPSGAVARLPRLAHAPKVKIKRREDLDWLVIIEREGQTVHTVWVPRDLPRGDKLGWETLTLPADVVEAGYDALRAVVTWGPGPHVIQRLDPIGDPEGWAPVAAEPDTDADDDDEPSNTRDTD